ncbi:MAG: TonB-dependent siderophore receptor [Acinetobacter sp.]
MRQIWVAIDDTVPPNRLRLSRLTLGIFIAALGWGGLSTAQAAESLTQQQKHTTGKASQNEDEDVRQLDAVTVTAKTKRQVVTAGALGSRTDLQTPFSTKTVSSKDIEKKQAKSISKLFEGEAGVSATGSTYLQSAYALTVRGIPLDFVNNYKIDGHPFQMQGVEMPLELFDQVQLLAGATGFLYGFGAPGGIVNYVSKKPTNEKTLSVNVGYSSDSIFSQHIDVGGKFGQDKRFSYRFNLVNEKGEAYNGTKVDRQAASLYLDAQLTPSLYGYVNGMYQERDLTGNQASLAIASSGSYAFSGASLPTAISGRKNLSQYPGVDYYNSKVWTTAAGLIWTINDHWTLSNSYSHTVKRIETRFETLYLRNAQGDFNVGLNRYYQPTLTFDDYLSVLEGSFQTGWLKHKFVGGLQYTTQTRQLGVGDTSQNPATYVGGQNYMYTSSYPAGNIYNSSLGLGYDGTSSKGTFRISNWYTTSAFLSDTVSLGKWSLLLGLRKTDYLNNNYYVSGAFKSAYHKRPLSPTYALLFNLRPDTTLYTSYIEAQEDGGTVGTTYANSGTQLAPIKSKQYEVGIKSEHQNWSLKSALFRVERGAGYAASDNIYTNDGVVRFNGFSINGAYKPVPSLNINAGGSWIDSKYTKGATSVLDDEAAGVPGFQGVFGIDKDILAIPGLNIHANYNYVAQAYITVPNTVRAKSYSTVSVGTSYQTLLGNHPIIYRAELNNIFDKKYWLAAASVVTQGAPRTLSLNVQYKF